MKTTDVPTVSIATCDERNNLSELISPICPHCGRQLGRMFVYVATWLPPNAVSDDRSGLGYHPDCAVEVGQSLMDTGLSID